MQTISRRKLLAGLLATSALNSSKSIAGLASSPNSRRQVLIVGAGLSGLYAARMLEQHGFSVQVVEARSRVGGCVYTLDEVPGRPEAGGNSVGANYGRVLDSAARLNVQIQQQLRDLPSDYYVDGTHLTASDWQNWDQNPFPESLKKRTPDQISGHFLKEPPFISAADWHNSKFAQNDVSAADFFSGKGLNDKSISLLSINNSYGNTLVDTSLLSLYRVHSNINRLTSMRQYGLEASEGNMRIPEAMAKSLAQAVALDQRIIEVNQTGSTVTAISNTGTSYEADAVIIALPVPAVRTIHFTPGLADEQNTAFEAIAYHKITQAHLIAKEPFWTTQGHNGSFWTNSAIGRIFTRPIPNTELFNMTVWINGNECDAFDTISEDLAKEKIMQEFFKVYPSANNNNVELRHLIRWQNESLNRGTWAIWQPGQIEKYFNQLQKPADRLFFAGEHTAYSNSGMEGAAESGERAALEVARRLA